MHGVKTKAGLHVLECEYCCEFQSGVAVLGPREVLSVELISLDVRYRLAEWKRL